MHQYEVIKIQNIYNFTDSSKIINEFELVKEVFQLCYRIKVLGTKSTLVSYYRKKGETPVQMTVDELSKEHKAIILMIMVIMGKEPELGRLFFEGGYREASKIVNEVLEVPKSVREFRERFLKNLN